MRGLGRLEQAVLFQICFLSVQLECLGSQKVSFSHFLQVILQPSLDLVDLQRNLVVVAHVGPLDSSGVVKVDPTELFHLGLVCTKDVPVDRQWYLLDC